MKRVLWVGFLGFFGLALMGQGKIVKTIADLKIAYLGEMTASTRYAANAEVAKKEGFYNIALMFEATSKAESVHARNHLAVLEKLGAKVPRVVLETTKTATTVENLADGIRGETWEYESMYPPMVKNAEAEEVWDAATSFRYAKDTEKRHRAIYEKALIELQAGRENAVSAVWYVCPTCGNTYNSADLAVSCEFCGTLRPRFIIFK